MFLRVCGFASFSLERMLLSLTSCCFFSMTLVIASVALGVTFSFHI